METQPPTTNPPTTTRSAEAPRTLLRGRGLLPDSPAVQAKIPSLRGLLGAPAGSPTSFSLSHLTPDVRDQGSSLACVAFALCSAVYTRLRFLYPAAVPPIFGPRTAYALGRGPVRVEGQPLVDHGLYPWLLIQTLTEWGLPPEELLPWDPDKVNEELPWDALQSATEYRLTGVRAIADDGEGRIASIKHAISHGMPVLFSTLAGEKFESYRSGTLEHEPDGNGAGHMMFLDAYEGDEFHGVNSWGPGFGIKGGFYATKKYLLGDTGHFYIVEAAFNEPEKKKEE